MPATRAIQLELRRIEAAKAKLKLGSKDYKRRCGALVKRPEPVHRKLDAMNKPKPAAALDRLLRQFKPKSGTGPLHESTHG